MVNSLVPKPDSSDLSNEDVSPLDHIQATVCKEEQLFLSHTHPPPPSNMCLSFPFAYVELDRSNTTPQVPKMSQCGSESRIT